MKKLVIFLSALLSILPAGPLFAEVDFPDLATTASYWPGYPYLESYDYFGDPDLKGVSFTFEDHYLTGIYIEYSIGNTNQYSGHYSYEAFAPGDWFFSFDGDIDWDIVLTTASDGRSDLVNYEYKDWTSLQKMREETDWYIYDLSNHQLDYDNTSSYINAGTDLYPYNWTGRTGHPALAVIPEGISPKDINFSGWIYEDNGSAIQNKIYSAFWDLSNSPIFLGDKHGEFTYGFTLTCANDLLYGQAPIPAPEPGTLLLLGAGLLGLGAVARRRRR